MEIRAARMDDVDSVVAIHNQVRADDPIDANDMRSWMSQALAVQLFAALDGRRTVAAGAGGLFPQRPQVHAGVWVPREHRRRGAGTALYEAISRWAEEQGRDELEVWIHDSDAVGIDFAKKRGFVEDGRELMVALDLTAIEAPAVEPPPGVEIVTWAERPELARGIYEVACEASPDIPGNENDEMEPFEDWLAHDMQGSGDRPEATFLALAGDEVVGYSKFSLTNAQPTTAHHDLTGVKRAWRGRGVARALKHAQIQWAKEAGYERLVTGNEERNEPIRRLNARLGYRPWSGRTLLKGPLASRARTPVKPLST
jgi:GNAT superfamily N-acetyltransferase